MSQKKKSAIKDELQALRKKTPLRFSESLWL
jgi:hypothetical protein